MDLRRDLFYIGVRTMTALVAALGFSLDYSGGSIAGINTSNWGLIGLIAFGVFALITLIREIDSAIQPHPKIEYDSVSPDKAQLTDIVNMQRLGIAYFVRLAFKNNAKNPSGDNSTADSTTASIRVIDKNRNVIDSWNGRWANNGEPDSFPNEWAAAKLDLAANNQQAILDIGYRLIGDNRFQGWDNGRYFNAPQRKLIDPGSYEVQVTLAASNYKKHEWQFSLFIPNEPQSDNLEQVKILLIKKP